MSRSAISPLSVGATAPEALSLLHQRLLVAEEQAEALIRDMGSLGVSRDQLLEPVEHRDPTERPLSPLKMRQALGREAGGDGMLWRQCDSLVSRVCHVESLLQTLKLTTFRLQTERELDPSHTARLKQQLAALLQESEEDQRASRREVMKLRDQLRQACREREEARREVQRLGEALEAAAAAKMDVALAAEELKIVKVQMSEKLMEMKEQMSQESARSFEAMKSHSELLQRVEEMERVVENERRQAQLVQSDYQVLRLEVQTGRQRLQEEQDKTRRLEERGQQLREQTEVKDSLVAELKTELKSVRLALHKQQTENSKLLKDIRELRAAADKVQALNNELENQCTQLSSGLRSLTVENAKQQSEHQASLKAERSRVVKQLQEQDLLLEAARRNIQAELQVALSDKVSLQMELEKLKADHGQLLQSSSIAQETAVTQKELLERTIERLRGELVTAKNEEAVRKDRDGSKNELCLVVTKLERERSALEIQLNEAKQGVGSLTSALQRQKDENRRLKGKMATMEQQQHAGKQVDQMLKELTDSKNKLAYEKGKLQTRVDELLEELKALKEDKAAGLSQDKTDKLCELEAWQGACGRGGSAASRTLENILASHTRLQLNSQTLQQELGGREQELATLKKDRLQAQREIRRHRAEVGKLQDLLTSTNSKSNRALESLRKALDTAKLNNKRLAKSLEQAVSTNSSLQTKLLEQARDQHHAAITLRDEELRQSRTKIDDLSEELDSLKHQTSKENESSMRTLHREITELRKSLEDSSARSGDLSRANRKLRQRVSELERLVSSQKARLRKQKSQLRQQLENRDTLDNSQKDKKLEESARKVPEDKEESGRKLQEARMESQQITVSVEDEHNWFKSGKLGSQREREQIPEGDLDNRDRSPGSSKDGAPTCSKYDTKAKGDPEWERWAFTIQRWETKRELARIAGGCRPGRTQLLTHSH